LPHSNFHPELEISDDGRSIKIGGPMDRADADVVRIAVSAFVTQKPEHRADPPAVQQGATGTSCVELDHAALALTGDRWECSASSEGGAFREDWAFASAELVEVASDGSIEKYTWSQWVWLHP
jgi:hypothetical protein